MSVLTSIPTDGFLGSSHSGAAGVGVATAVFPVGTKVTVKQDVGTGITAGYCTFVYMQFDGETVAAAAKLCAQMHVYDATDLSTFQLTTDQSDMILKGPGAVCLGVVTDAYFAFFQCGGPICNGNATALAVTTLDGNFVTDGSVAAGSLCFVVSDTAIADGTLISGGTVSQGFILAGKADTSNAIDAEWLYIVDKFPGSL